MMNQSQLEAAIAELERTHAQMKTDLYTLQTPRSLPANLPPAQIGFEAIALATEAAERGPKIAGLREAIAQIERRLADHQAQLAQLQAEQAEAERQQRLEADWTILNELMEDINATSHQLKAKMNQFLQLATETKETYYQGAEILTFATLHAAFVPVVEIRTDSDLRCYQFAAHDALELLAERNQQAIAAASNSILREMEAKQWAQAQAQLQAAQSAAEAIAQLEQAIADKSRRLELLKRNPFYENYDPKSNFTPGVLGEVAAVEREIAEHQAELEKMRAAEKRDTVPF